MANVSGCHFPPVCVVDCPTVTIQPLTVKTRAELDPETVSRILAIAREGDTTIRDLNLCVGQYEGVRGKVSFDN